MQDSGRVRATLIFNTFALTNTSLASASIADKHRQGQHDAVRTASCSSYHMRIHMAAVGPEALSSRE